MTSTATISSNKNVELEKLLTFLDIIQYYAELIADVEIQTAPLELHDRKQRRRMVTLLSKPEALYVFLLIYKHAKTARTNWRLLCNQPIYELGERITPANISRVLWKHSNIRDQIIEPTQAQRVQAARFVEASLHFKLVDPDRAKNRKEKPIKASPVLVNLVEQLTDYSKYQFGLPLLVKDTEHPLSEFVNRNSSQWDR